MYIIRSKTKVREISESAKNEGVRRKKRAALSTTNEQGEKSLIFNEE
jgi:hypothetical protein